MNLYAYVEGDPVNAWDFEGLRSYTGFVIFGTYYFGGKSFTPYNPRKLLVGPAGGVCGQAGSYLATWIPDITLGSCRRHDDCYSSCAKQCKDYSCKKDCDNEFLKKNPAYGAFVVIAIGDKAYRDALTLNGCECVNPEN